MGLLRFAVIALVVANVFVLTWRQFHPPEAMPPEVETLPPETAPDIPSIALVSEIRGLEDEARVAPEVTCYSMGPFHTLLEARRAQRRVRASVEAVRQRETTAVQERGWWVHLPPAADRGAAVDLAEELAGRGVEDYFVITGGEMENAVSLGLFEDRANARTRQEAIAALGYDARMELQHERAPRFWVDYRVRGQDASPWQYVLDGSPTALRRPIPCWEDQPSRPAPRVPVADPAPADEESAGPDPGDDPETTPATIPAASEPQTDGGAEAPPGEDDAG